MFRFRSGLRVVQIAFAALCTAGVVYLLFTPSGFSAPRPEAPLATAAFNSGKQLVIIVRAEPYRTRAVPVAVELLAPREERLRTARQELLAGEEPRFLRFVFPRPGLTSDRITVRCSEGKWSNDVPLSKILLVKAHETTLFASPTLIAGSRAALRCSVHGVRSLTESIPLPASVTASLTGADNKVHSLFTGRTNGKGVADVRFQVPDVKAGSYKMEVVTKSMLGEEKLQRDVKVQTSARLLITTDKPLYQPGQTIHLRALALRTFDLIPVGKSPITLEVEDGKGNKVFKKALETSTQGIAQTDFTLADEVNMGEYRIRALLEDQTAEKTVAVKRYVLPRFKVELKTERTYYLPQEIVKGTLHADYFFGKPAAGATVEIKAGAPGAAFHPFQVWKGKTDAAGHAEFSMRLPASFVGSALRLEAGVTDAAQHTETASAVCPVSKQPIQVSIIPEGGRVVPDLENCIFVAALYPDGKPAQCSLEVWVGKTVKGKSFATLHTNEAGLAVLKWTPERKQFRAGEWTLSPIEFLGGVQHHMTPEEILDLTVLARDGRGNRARTTAALNAAPREENVLLGLDRAIGKAGDSLAFDVQTSAGQPTVYLEVIKLGQRILTRWFPVKNGRASGKLDLPADVFGALEVHAYQILPFGEIIRDTRVLYVQPTRELKIKVSADKDVYKPGAEGVVRFEVSDADGKPTAAALGVLIVDEAVYALQEMQPGLELVYFTLQQELLKPKAEAGYRPAESMDALVRERSLGGDPSDDRQKIARVLLAAVRPPVSSQWDVAPDHVRKQQLQDQIGVIGSVVFGLALEKPTILVLDKQKGRYRFPSDLLDRKKMSLEDPLGGKITLKRLAELAPGFTPERLALMLTRYRMESLVAPLQDRYAKRKQWFKLGTDRLLERMVVEASLQNVLGAVSRKDAWGRDLKLIKRSLKDRKTPPLPGLPGFTLASAGPDGKFNTDDDIVYAPMNFMQTGQVWWKSDVRSLAAGPPIDPLVRKMYTLRGYGMWGGGFQWGGGLAGLPGGLGGGLNLGGGAAGLQVGGFNFMGSANLGIAGGRIGVGGGGFPSLRTRTPHPVGGQTGRTAAPPPRLREHFPETLLWQPSLITDERGRATLKVPFADSITTWRLSASASSLSGTLGGVSAPLRVFQDFFVDLDLPTALTQNDEVAFPIAVYNYLKTPQTVTLDLKPEPWFDLVDGQGFKRSLKLEANQVTAVKYRIRAKKVGRFPLRVDAHGTKTSDAIKRSIEVLPDGTPVEQIHSDRLKASVTHTVTLPPTAIDGASRLMVKIYPGIYSQLLEGVEGMLRMPTGCFEQTSSSTYPNILALDYLKRNRIASPGTLVLAEGYLNAGYQRLLTFERPGGGFDLWGKGPPDVWLSAYGLQEFADMAKVYPIDRSVIERTRTWLMKQQAADGTWTMPWPGGEGGGDRRLMMTSYVAWALLDSMTRPSSFQEEGEAEKLKKAIDYLCRYAVKADDAYVLALAANALAAWDAQDKANRKTAKPVVDRLLARMNRKPEQQAICFTSKVQSLCYSYGDCMTVETTSLAVLALARSGQSTTTINQALAYLVKNRGGDGTWGSTQPTILALKALVAGMGGGQRKGTTPFVIKVGSKQVAEGKVTEANSDVMQQFDLREHLRTGANEVSIEVKGETALMYQVVGRHFEPYKKAVAPVKSVLEVSVAYDRTRLTTADLLKAKATLRYRGKRPAYQVIVELPIPPGFTVDEANFARMAAAKKVQRFSITARQVILYVADIKPESLHEFAYALKPKYPIKAKAPAAVAYEYYTPTNRAATTSVALVVTEKK